MRARSVRTSVAWKCAASALFALFVCLRTAPARADDAQQFELLQGVYNSGQWEDLVKRTAILLDPSNPPCASAKGAATTPQTCHLADGVLIERSREMEIVALVGLKRDGEADATIEKILRQNPAYVPDPASLPAGVLARVRDIKTRMQKELEDKARKEADEKRKQLLSQQAMSEDERKWLAEIQRLASKETVVEKRSRLYAFVPFGVGQFQNGDKGWGWFFLTTEALLGGTSIGLASGFSYYASIDTLAPPNEKGEIVNRAEVRSMMTGFAVSNQIVFSAWAALAIAGVVQANVAFQPETVTTRDRPIPKRPTPTVLPTAGVSSSGVTFGVVGTF